ncbi:MAG: hypothetical protein JNL25_01810 [Rhodospirillaceae bacterium]|nr:hypothetical protein [Rhodospirillaceae bacterium]
MSDDDFLRALEEGTLSPSAFDHAAHIRAGYLYLTRLAFTDAIDAMRRAVKGVAARNGKDGLYHETITVAFMTLINERRAQGGGDWEDFRATHGDLFTGNPLAGYYSRERLESPLARRIFLLPDRVGPRRAAA